MKAKLLTRAIAMILSVIMVVSLLPSSAFAYESSSNMEYIGGGSTEAALYEQLGYGFNALEDTTISDISLKNGAGIVIDYDKVRASLLSTSYSEGKATYAKTAQELLLSFGINYSDHSDAGVPIENAKLGISTKFGFSGNLSYEKITESLYYYYREEILTGRYSLILPQRLLDDPSQIISKDFVYALEALNSNCSDKNCAAFFKNWGTHILVSYNKGAALEYVAVGHSTDKKFSADADLQREISATVGIAGDLLKADRIQALAVSLKGEYGDKTYNLMHKWYGMGGDSNLIGAIGTDAGNISLASIENWKKSVSGDKSVLIPHSTEWISIWELIPDTYASVKNALQAYYKTKAEGLNAAFFSKFTNYSAVSGAADIYYTSPTGYISKIAYETDGNTKVAPGSSFKIVSSDADLSNIVFPYSSQYTVDKYGTVTIGDYASGKITIRVTDLEGNEISGATKTFTVEKEGKGLYEGGYGTEERPYLIANATQFSNVRNYPSKFFVLTTRISLGNIPPIPNFTGTFDGASHTLKDWTYSPTSSGNVGLFETIGEDGVVKNLYVNNPRVVSKDGAYGTLNMGVICGTNYGTIENVVVNGIDTVNTNNAYTLNGKMGSIDQETDSHTYVGGICGTNYGTIQHCGVKDCAITGYSGSGRDRGTANTWVGGIAGRTMSDSKIYDCFSHTNLIEGSAVGKTWYNWGTKGACGWINLGGVVGRTDGSGIIIERVLGYDNGIAYYTLEGKDTENNEGSLIGYVFSEPTMMYCYSESTDTLFGRGFANGASKVESLTAAGVINNLNGFAANGWVQSSSGGNLYFAQNFVLDIRGLKTEYFVGEPFTLEGATIEVVKDDAAETRIDVTGGIRFTGYNPNKTGSQILLITNYSSDFTLCRVTVSKPTVTDIVISSTPYKTAYFKPFEKTNFAGEELDFTGLSVIAQYNDGTSAEVPIRSLTLPNTDIVTETGNVTVKYSGYSKSYKIEALDVLPSKISVVEGSYKKNYALGDSFDATGLKATLTYNNGDEITLDEKDLTINSAEFMQNGASTYNIAVEYEGVETTFDVIVGSVKNISIVKKPNKLNYYSCENLDTTGLSLNVTYDNEVTKTISSGFTTSGYDNTKIGQQVIRVSYGGATTTFQITVIGQHNYTEKTVAPSCSNPGYTMYTCSKCNHSYTEAISATDHTPVTDKAVAATCTTAGKTEGSHCSVCNAVIKAQTTIPATGHSYSYTDKGETHEAVCGKCAHSMTEGHSYTDNTCICGAVEVLAPITDSSIIINHSLNLASDISINYAVRASLLSDYDSFYLEVQVPIYRENTLTGFKALTIEPVLKGSYYYFTMTDLTAVNMNDMLVATLHMNKGEQEYLSKPDNYSVATYAMVTLNQSNAAHNLKVLCADLLRYGAAAQVYKNYRTDALATANMTDAHKTYFSDLGAVTFGNTNNVYNDLSNPMITWAGKTMNLSSKVVVKFVFNAGAYTGDISKLTLRMIYQGSSGAYHTVTLSNPTAYNEAKRMYAFDFDGLMAAELRTALSVAVYNGDTQLSQTMQYSADTYGNSASGTLLELCKALFAYSDSAKTYFTK